MSSPVRIELPFLPPSEYNPNSRVHWTTKHAASQAVQDEMVIHLRALGWVLSSALIPKTGVPKLQWDNPIGKAVVYVWYGLPDKRRRDWDNLIAATKPILDGLPLADDDVRSIRIVPDWFDSPRNPKTIIEIIPEEMVALARQKEGRDA